MILPSLIFLVIYYELDIVVIEKLNFFQTIIPIFI